MTIEVQIKILPNGRDLPPPTYATAGSAGMDVCAASNARIEVGSRMMVPCGFAVAIPDGYEMQVRPRSGLAVMRGITVLNSPGCVDSDYRGEVCVILINHGFAPFTVYRGDRIAQLTFTPVVRANLVKVAELSETSRGASGFGSTGV